MTAVTSGASLRPRLRIDAAVIGPGLALAAMIIVYSNSFNTAKLFVPVITIALMGLVLTNLAKMLEERIAPWKQTERAI